MKHAKVGDYKRKLSNCKPKRGVSHVQLSDSKELPFFLVNSVCGLNGSGKTRFLRAISAGEAVEFEGITVIQEGSNAKYINPSLWVNEVLMECHSYKRDGEFESIIPQYEAIVLEAQAIRDVNYILQSSFDSVEIYNIEKLEGRDADEDSNTFQYCMASKRGLSLDSVSLSHGELYVILLVGLLHGLNDYDALLIDEAEAFLSPVAQARLANVLLKCSVEPKSENVQIIVATHSPFMLDAIGYDNSFTMERGISGLNFNVATKRILDTIGLSTSAQNILLFEDNKARLLTEYILDRCLPAWQHSNIAVALGGESDMRTVKKMVSSSGSSKVLLVFDADIKEKAPLNNVEKEYSLILPGELAPEEELIQMVIEKPESFICQFNSHERKILDVALLECFQLDHHDFFIELSRRSSINEFELFRKAFDIWFEAKNEECLRFVTEFMRMTA